MSRRPYWIALVALVALAGLLGGVFLVFSLNALGDNPVEPTLAPVAAQVEPSPSPQPAAEDTPLIPPTPSPEPAVVKTALVPVPEASPTSAIPLTPTAAPTTAPFVEYTVQPGDTVISIATVYGVSVDDIVRANQLSDADNIVDGQRLLIPTNPGEYGAVSTATPVPAAETDAPQTTATAPAAPPATPSADAAGQPADWPPSVTSGDLSANYPLLQQTASRGLLIHYQPGTYPAQNIQTLAPRIDEIFGRLQAEMGGALQRQVDVYLGGTLFGVNPSLQGFTQSYEFRTFVLVNGAFHPGERDYILGHELTHVTATHILGPASSTMIHEGLATYLPQRYLTEEAGYLPINQICAAAYRTDAFRSAAQLSQLAYGPTAFGGHIRTFFNYNLSGCFVGYLLEDYDMAQLDQVYDSGDYRGVYGMSLSELDAAWQTTLEATSPSVDAAAFVSLVEEIAAEYEDYVNASAGGDHDNYSAYLHLNAARLEVNRGNLQAAQRELQTYRSLMG